MRLLDPANDNSAAINCSKEVARDARDKAAADLAHQCTARGFKEMIKERKKASKELASIFIQGAELGWSLWAQKMRYEVLGLQSLQQLEQQQDRLCFDSRSEYLQADRLNSAALDKRPEALDGVPIALVVSPAVIATGTPDGADPCLRRVWKKATVLIDD